MATPRHHLVPPGVAGFYHCINRCVRRAWLCGVDPVSQKNFDHRRDLIIDRMKELTGSFAVDIYAYAVMSNHVHIVLYIEPDRVKTWSDQEVVVRWKRLYRWRNPKKPVKIPKNVCASTLKEWRRRLGDLSWFMQTLNEPIARLANAEDDCTGRFWEGRFKSRPLLDDGACTAGMVYTDLNPVQAGLAESLEDSDFTSIQERIRLLPFDSSAEKSGVGESPTERIGRLPLLPIATSLTAPVARISLSVNEYIELVSDSMGKALSMACEHRDQIVESLGIKKNSWCLFVTDFLTLFRSAVGNEKMLVEFMDVTGRSRRQDVAARKLVYQ